MSAAAALAVSSTMCQGMFTVSKLGAGGKDISAMIENSMNSDCDSEGIRGAQVLSLFILFSYPQCMLRQTHASHSHSFQLLC